VGHFAHLDLNPDSDTALIESGSNPDPNIAANACKRTLAVYLEMVRKLERGGHDSGLVQMERAGSYFLHPFSNIFVI
jgi:hypothetical protein